MKYIKKFENIANNLQVGDYIISYVRNREQTEKVEYILDIGQILKIRKASHTELIILTVNFSGKEEIIHNLNEDREFKNIILFVSKSKKEAEEYLEILKLSQKYDI